MANIQRIKGKPGDQYEVLFVDQHGHLVVALTEWYRLRTQQGATSTRDTYLTCLLPFFAFLAEKGLLLECPAFAVADCTHRVSPRAIHAA